MLRNLLWAREVILGTPLLMLSWTPLFNHLILSAKIKQANETIMLRRYWSLLNSHREVLTLQSDYYFPFNGTFYTSSERCWWVSNGPVLQTSMLLTFTACLQHTAWCFISMWKRLKKILSAQCDPVQLSLSERQCFTRERGFFTLRIWNFFPAVPLERVSYLNFNNTFWSLHTKEAQYPAGY